MMMKSLGLAVLLGLLAVPATAASLSVKATATKPAVPAAPERVVRPSADLDYWLSGAGGLIAVDDGAQMWTHGFGGYLAGESLIGGVRARFNRGFSYVRHGRELGLLVGQRFGNNDNRRWRGWVAAGLGRYEYDRRDPNNPEHHEILNLPMEAVVTYGFGNVALEFRTEADINEAKRQVMLGLGLEFGKLR